MRTSRTFTVARLALLLVPFGCDDAVNGNASDGGTGLPDGAIVQADGAVVLPDGAVLTNPDSGPPPGPGASGCQALVVEAGAKVEGANADNVTWYDADCKKRIVPLVRNDGSDPFGSKGGFARSFTYDANGKTRVCKGTGSNGWNGFGYIVSHYDPDAAVSVNVAGKWRTVLAGKHHSIHEFTWRLSPGGPMDVTAHWFFATGRSHPVFAVLHDATPAGKDKLTADARSPYGDINFDETGGAIDGDGWGDKYRFVTTSSPVTETTKWDYTKTNEIPYVVEWSNSADAEMGLVQTQSWEDKEAGGDYGGPAIKDNWGKSGDNLLTTIANWQWPYQLNQYEIPFLNSSHRLAWGASFGAVGQSSYQAFGKTLVGYPYQSYSVYIVLGSHTTSAVDAQVAEMEAVQKVKLSASRGTVASEGPRLGGKDTIPFTPAGFDPVYGAWTVDAASDAATVQIDVGSASLRNPVLVLRGYASAAPPSSVTFGGKTLTADTDYFATVDADGKRLWITLNATITGSTALTVN